MHSVKISRRDNSADPAHPPYKGGTKEFDGEVDLRRLVTAQDSGDVELLAVWFSPGARTRPHVHDVDQVLHIVEGDGIVADEKDRHFVKAGEVITVPAHAWHWHGATPDSGMMHISIRKQGSSTNWEVDQKDWATAFNEWTR